MANFQDLFCEKIRLSELKEKYFGHDSFVKKFGVVWYSFDFYYADNESGEPRSVIFGGTDVMEDWNSRFDEIIEKYGDIRVCYMKNIESRDVVYRGIDYMSVKDLINILNKLPEDANIYGHPKSRLKEINYIKDNNTVEFNF